MGCRKRGDEDPGLGKVRYVKALRFEIEESLMFNLSCSNE